MPEKKKRFKLVDGTTTDACPNCGGEDFANKKRGKKTQDECTNCGYVDSESVKESE